MENFKECKEKGKAFFEFLLLDKNQKPQPVFLILQQITLKGIPFISCYQFKMSDINASPDFVSKRNQLLVTINEITDILLTQIETKQLESNLDVVMHDVLHILGSSTRADRCFI